VAKLQDEIAHAFLEKLRESTDVTPEMIEALRQLLSAKKKLRADDLQRVFAPPLGGDVK
jgi:hypothetical protein